MLRPNLMVQPPGPVASVTRSPMPMVAFPRTPMVQVPRSAVTGAMRSSNTNTVNSFGSSLMSMGSSRIPAQIVTPTQDGKMNKVKWNNHKSTFFEILKTQREKSNYTDATLAVDGIFYPVHKLVMSTCSEYFSEIFEKTACKSPVIVLKDVQCHDIEALLDYIYVGEVDINQDNLASFLKTAECLRIKGLGVPDECQTELWKNSSSSHDDAGQYSSPPKRRRHDSSTIPSQDASPVPLPQNTDTAVINTTPNKLSPNPPNTDHSATASVNSAHALSIPTYSTTNTSNTSQDQSTEVKVEVDEAEEQENGIVSKDINKPGAHTDVEPEKVCEFDILKIEHDPEHYDNNSLELSLQELNQSTLIDYNQEFYGAASSAGPSIQPCVQQWPHLAAYFTTERAEGKAENAYIATCMYCKPNMKKICIYKYTLNNISRHFKSTHPFVVEEFKEAISRGSGRKGFVKEAFPNSYFSQL